MLDAIIISDSSSDSYSASSPLRLKINGRIALIQNVRNYLNNKGKIIDPIIDGNKNNWHCAPKLNGIKLYDYLQKQGHSIQLIDSYWHERNDFINLMKDNPKAVIISTTFILNKDTLNELADDIRSIAPDIFIIAGGPFVLSSYLLLRRSKEKGYDLDSPKNDYLFLSKDNRPDIDLYIIDKTGEKILSEALRRLKFGDTLKSLPNTAQWNGKEYVFSSRKRLPLADIEIDWTTVPDKIFENGVINVQASVGCPFNCKYCNFVKDKHYTFIKPIDLLIEELKSLSNKGIKYIRFVDDNFRLGKNDLNDICKRFINEQLDLKWMSFIRASSLIDADLELLKKSGCIEVQIGIESADRIILTNMNKHADPEMYYTVVSNLLDVGINCSCCFIVGFPGETRETFERTVNFIQNITKDKQEGIFFWSMYPFLLAPLSPIYESKNRSKYNLEGYMNKWKHITMNSEQANKNIMEAFIKIDNASPIYSGDNIDMLMKLPLEKRKEFMRLRHKLSKRFLNEPFHKKEVLSSFSKIFSQRESYKN